MRNQIAHTLHWPPTVRDSLWLYETPVAVRHQTYQFAKKRRILNAGTDGVLHMQPMFVSHNEKYAPKVVSPELNFQITGRVLS